ncbi:hypothetical protein WT97_20240 [Burkholderia sp. MSMB1459WGS]|nr:hypothetical protein WT24_25290 [Burkholderia sp. MSMB1078WGS]KWO40816.1 hypothetical protein WT97_20240 [Burkholderia sp. MSMB1459WGS]
MIWVSRHVQRLHRICIQIHPTDGHLFIEVVGAVRSDIQSDAIDSIRYILDISLDVLLVHCNMLKRGYNQLL